MSRSEHPVLIVEDDPDIGQALRDILCDDGYSAEVAGDGLAALNYLHSHPTPTLIFLDWNMAPMNGPEFLTELTKEFSNSKIPIVLLSADMRVADKAQDARVVAYLAKPIDLDELFRILAQYCD